MITAKSTNTLRILFALAVLMVMAGVAFPATYTVTNTNDSGSGSLREAIESANDNPGQDLIAFNIPGSGPHTIQPELLPLMPWETYPILALPMITDPVIIDGYTQPGAQPATYSSPATLLIEIDGINAIDEYWVNGLSIAAGNCTIRGLVINHFGDCGIRIHENGGNIIQGNYLGTDVTGTGARPNHDSGVAVSTLSNTIGGTTPEARNVLSGNGACGAGIGGTGNTVVGNYIGTDATGTADLGNGYDGVHMGQDSSGNTIGPDNVISCNGGTGVQLLGNGESGNHLIVGNLIGTDASGTKALGNTFGVGIVGKSNNTVKDNIVANSLIVGIGIVATGPEFGSQPANYNTVTGNTISLSGEFGIQIESSHYNTIYNNNFIDNSLMIGYPTVDHLGIGNTFNLDKPLGGNYWSDWTGPDINCDSFVDLPYLIWTVEDPSGEHGYDNQDNLPWSCPDGWLTGCDCSGLMDQVEALDLPKDTENSLRAKLDNAAKKLGDRNMGAAINLLQAFINEVEAQRGKKISVTDADGLIDAAQTIIDLLESM